MKKILSVFCGLVMVFAFAVTVFAAKPESETPKSPADYNGLNTGDEFAHLYLYPKDSTNNYVVDDNGTWGKLTFNKEGETFDYTFNGHKLVPNGEYTLIYYPAPWPGNGLICLGSGTANKGGNVHLEDSVDTGDLPVIYDENYPDDAKIWLILSNDVQCNGSPSHMRGWNPNEYLFEYNTVVFDDIDNFTITLENKNPSGWSAIEDDDKYGLLNYDSSGSSFKYYFLGYDLLAGGYSLIYYADGWPGNHPGALLGSGETNSEGNLILSGNLNLNMDLPSLDDGNLLDGAKIWLVPSSIYNESERSMIQPYWTPANMANILFEMSRVWYTDTDVAP